MQLSETLLVIPRGVPGLEPLHLDLSQIYDAEARAHEVAIVTKTKAPELLSLFNRAWLEAKKLEVKVALELAEAKQNLAKVKAMCILDKCPQILKDKGYSSSKDLRDAVIAIDEDCIKAQDRLDAIEAVKELLRIKAEHMMNCHQDVKKILGESAYDHRNLNLTGDTGTVSPGTITTTESYTIEPGRSGFGKPRY